MLENEKKPPFILGTRGSVLALTQAHALLSELKKLEPSFSYETKIITTQGDQITDKPLWQLEGKDFFTKELDESLLSNKVDMVIHSLKDLSSSRPENIDLIAISKRKFPNDILFFKNEIVEKIKKGTLKKITIGTSSPRRVFQITNHLNKFIPHGSNIKVETKSLRGNVNTRINKLLTDQFDAICLAFAGVERISQNNEHEEVIHLLRDNCTFMLLPIHSFTPSPGQGALAVETCKSNPRYQEIKELFSKVNSPNDRQTCLKEKQVFAEYGGNCHLALGVFSQLSPQAEVSLRINGIIEEKIIDKKEFPTIANQEIKFSATSKFFIGLPGKDSQAKNNIVYDRLIKKEKLELDLNQIKTDSILVTSQHAISDNHLNHKALTFAAGEKTSQGLAEKNVWVYGTFNERPYHEFQDFCASSFMEIYLGKEPTYKILSHNNSGHCSEVLINSYQHNVCHELVNDESLKTELSEVEAFYWTSYSQFQKYKEIFSFIVEKPHFCGIGRTFERFQENKIENITPLFGINHFKQIFNL